MHSTRILAISQSETKPILSQFLNQNKVSVASLRDFKKTARELIEACRIKSNIHPLLADHTFREAERFLEMEMDSTFFTGGVKILSRKLESLSLKWIAKMLIGIRRNSTPTNRTKGKFSFHLVFEFRL
jgi:hypothetical protein